jgi:hypothetical protein
MWGYLEQFWNAITQVGDYTIEWFQNIGNAVAGAIGGMFDWLIHYVSDVFIFLGWLFSILKELIMTFLSPVAYTFNFLKSFTLSAFSGAQSPPVSYTFSNEIMSVFNTIPYWSVLCSIIGVAILVILGIVILRLFLNLT